MIGLSWRRLQGPRDGLLQRMLADHGMDNVLCGWLRDCKRFDVIFFRGQIQSCVRPVDAAFGCWP